ncbi:MULTISPECIES: hypothetical protein [Streptomyces]|uniref:hypothetical protein n=1 Tax=Streptomyces TaxID=1883 RepID=UPI00099CB93E|nr:MULTISPECIES: hypothetical protein [Streptomyces]
MTTDPAVAVPWLVWTTAGLEGLCFKRLDEPYRPVRSWRKYTVRVTTEAVVGAVTGSLAAPRTLPLGRYDRAGNLRYTGRSTTHSQAAGRALAELLTPPTAAHPWQGWTFSAGWGTQRTLGRAPGAARRCDVGGIDVAPGCGRRWRHPARAHRVRTDIDVAQVPFFSE